MSNLRDDWLVWFMPLSVTLPDDVLGYQWQRHGRGRSVHQLRVQDGASDASGQGDQFQRQRADHTSVSQLADRTSHY